jgi:hypothetical protein
MSIVRVRIEDLTADAQEVQERAIHTAKTETERLIAEYRRLFGKHVGTDLARELFPDYAKSLDNKLKYATAVQKSAAFIADAVFQRLLDESNGGSALFTAGGTGAGKTTSLMRDGAGQRALEGATVIYDGNFNSFESSKHKIDQALAAHCKVIVIFVQRHPVEAYLQGVLPRSLEQGRTVPIEGHLRMHRDARKTFLKMRNTFVFNKNVSFMVLSNTGHESEAFAADIDYLKAIQYDQGALGTAIKEGLDNAYAKQKITKTLYDASCGNTRA